MVTKETFFRGRERHREPRRLPAPLYNLAITLLKQSGEAALFVPIRSMLFLAIADREEIIFVDGAASRTQIILSWQNFQPRERTSLEDPVAYEAVYFDDEALAIMPRLQGEFEKALRQLKEKSGGSGDGAVLPWPKT